jgi:ABC-2 type transport system permease protein
MATILSANAIVREKELGTLEQLYMTPVRRVEMVIGKMLPYLVLTTLEFCLVAFLMCTIFQVPITGHFVTLLALLLPFTLTMLGFGLLISTKADTRDAATQMAMGTLLPSIFLSGYVFPLDSMPAGFQIFAHFVPATWLIDASRGIILRGADWSALWMHALALWTMAIAVMTVSALKLR